MEFAILTPLVLLLIFGILGAGLAWNTKQQLTHAARDAARYGATLPTGSDIDAWTADVTDRARTTGDGLLNEAPDRRICVAYVSSSQTRRRVTTATDAGSTTSDESCFDDDLGDAARVQVSVQRDAEVFVDLIPPVDSPTVNVTMNSDAVVVFEVAPFEPLSTPSP